MYEMGNSSLNRHLIEEHGMASIARSELWALMLHERAHIHFDCDHVHQETVVA